MNIDKSRFLVLVSAIASSTAVVAIAASGCTVNNTTTNDAGVVPTTTPDGSIITPPAADGGTLGDSSTTVACVPETGEGPTCEGPSADGGTVAKCGDQCTIAGDYFKPTVQKAISDCLDKATPATPVPTDCSGAAPTCVNNAIAKSCDDATAATFCTTFLATCPDLADGGAPPQSDCVTFVRAMSDNGRGSLQSCVSEGGASCGECISKIRGVSPNP